MKISIGADHAAYEMKKKRGSVMTATPRITVLSTMTFGQMVAEDSTGAFLGAHFSNEERHVRRLDKVKGIEYNELS